VQVPPTWSRSARTLRRARRLDAVTRRRRAEARASGTSTAASSSTSPAASPARTSVTARRPSSRRSTSRSIAISISASCRHVRAVRRSLPPLDELWPGEAETKSILLNSGAEAIENAVKIARAATGRAGVVVFDRAFHGRTILTMAMTAKLVYKQGFGPLATDVYRAAAPYPIRGVSTEDALASLDSSSTRTSTRARLRASCSSPCRRGRFIPMPPEFVQALRRICDETGSCTSTTKCRPAAAAPARVGDRAARSRT